jgi:hypothetical protein
VWNVTFGLAVGLGERGFGVALLEHASVDKNKQIRQNCSNFRSKSSENFFDWKIASFERKES